MGNCENMCVDQKHKLMVEMEKENSMEEINKNRFKNIVKDKSEILSSQSIEKSPSQISQNQPKTVNKIQNFENGKTAKLKEREGGIARGRQRFVVALSLSHPVGIPSVGRRLSSGENAKSVGVVPE